MGDREVADLRARRDIDAEPFEKLFGLGFDPSPVDQIEESAEARLASEKNVRGDIEVRQNVQFLMNEPDAQPHRIVHRMDRDHFAVDANLARVRLMDAAEYFHQRGFTGARSEERV